MKQAITYDKLRVKCKLGIHILYECSYLTEPGSHSQAKITGILDDDNEEHRQEIDRLMQGEIIGEYIEVIKLTDTGQDEVLLFCGLIQNVELSEEGEVPLLTLHAISGTWLMDVEKKSRSFQDVSRTYKEIVQQIVSEQTDAAMIWNCEDRPIEKPLIQYQETDWQFVKRIISHLHNTLVPEVGRRGARFYVGLPVGSQKDFEEESSYQIRLQKNYFDARIGNQGHPRESKHSYLYYKIKSMENLQIGDLLNFKGKDVSICAKSAALSNGILEYTYKLSGERYFERVEYYNSAIKGVSFVGTVLETQKEVLKLHLEMDKTQDAKAAYPYSWRPMTGNLLYSMPEKGTKVSLYMQDEDERNAICIYSIRENGDTDSVLADTDKRYMTTQHDKRMYLYPEQTGLEVLKGSDKAMQIALQDATGILMKAIKKVSLMADKQITISGKNITFQAPQEITMVRKDIVSPTVINMNNAFDAIGKVGGFTGNQEVIKAPKKVQSISSTPSEHYDLKNAAIHVLCSIPIKQSDDAAVNLAIAGVPTFTKVQ